MKLSIVRNQRKKHKASNKGEMWCIYNVDGGQKVYQMGKLYSTERGQVS